MDTTVKKSVENEDKEIITAIIKGIWGLLRFGIYVVISFIKAIVNIIEGLFLKGYEPFKGIANVKDGILDKRAAKKVNKEKMRFAVSYKTQHRFEFARSEEFSNNYKVVQERLKDCTDPDFTLKEEVYKDILQRIDILIVEAESEALKNGYEYAKESKYRLESDEAYEEYLRGKILKGEGTSIYKKEVSEC